MKALVMGLTLGTLVAVAIAAGSNKPGESCSKDDECRKGHCYTRRTDNKQVCVDCSSSSINSYRDAIDEWCKDPDNKRSCKGSSQLEVSEAYYTFRIANNEKCATVGRRDAVRRPGQRRGPARRQHAKVDIVAMLQRRIRIQGIATGSTEMLQNLVRALATRHIHPVIDRRYAFADAPRAYAAISGVALASAA